MSNQAIARIQWISPAAGGRKQLPTGPRYTTVARFERQGDAWTKDAWSLVIKFIGPPDQALCHLAKVRFLVENGPGGWLEEGSKFELMEGPKVVARGVVTRA